jgi:hypothetical protein
MIQALIGTLASAPVATGDSVAADFRVEDDGGHIVLEIRAYDNVASMLLGCRAGNQLYAEGQRQSGDRFLALFIRPAQRKAIA